MPGSEPRLCAADPRVLPDTHPVVSVGLRLSRPRGRRLQLPQLLEPAGRGLGSARRAPRELEPGSLSPLQATGLHFRHTDNINLWLSAIAHVGLPPVTPGPGRGSARPRTSPPTLAALTPSRGPFALIAVSSDSVCGFRFLGAVLSSPRFPGGKSGWRLLP